MEQDRNQHHCLRKEERRFQAGNGGPIGCRTYGDGIGGGQGETRHAQESKIQIAWGRGLFRFTYVYMKSVFLHCVSISCQRLLISSIVVFGSMFLSFAKLKMSVFKAENSFFLDQ